MEQAGPLLSAAPELWLEMKLSNLSKLYKEEELIWLRGSPRGDCCRLKKQNGEQRPPLPPLAKEVEIALFYFTAHRPRRRPLVRLQIPKMLCMESAWDPSPSFVERREPRVSFETVCLAQNARATNIFVFVLCDSSSILWHTDAFLDGLLPNSSFFTGFQSTWDVLEILFYIDKTRDKKKLRAAGSMPKTARIA